jgi:hypothetical protein
VEPCKGGRPVRNSLSVAAVIAPFHRPAMGEFIRKGATVIGGDQSAGKGGNQEKEV